MVVDVGGGSGGDVIISFVCCTVSFLDFEETRLGIEKSLFRVDGLLHEKSGQSPYSHE
jgi:hypothetical protein